MANTFKLKSNANMPASAGTPLTLYTCPGSTTTIVLGLLLCFMWIGTDHQATKENLNILWANPFHLYIVWVIISKK